MSHRHLTVHFHGVAVHFNQVDNPELDLGTAAHRVVIPHYDKELQWGPKKIAVHEPFLHTDVELDLPCLPRMEKGKGRKKGKHSYRLNGVTFRVAGVDKLVGIQRKMECFPKLKTIWPEMVLDHAVVTGKKAPAAAYFDTTNGRLEAKERDGSAAATLVIEHEKDTAVLEVECWRGGSQQITVHLPATLTFEDTGRDKADGLSDFVLDYLVATKLPPADLDLSALEKVAACIGRSPSREVEPGELGPGCSNSQYP